MRLKSLLEGERLLLRAALVLVAAALAVGPIGGTACGEVPSDGESLSLHVDDPPYDPVPDSITTDLEAHPIEAYRAEDEAEPPELQSELKKVPEPATVVSLAGLAAMAGAALLLRLRWFRRR